MTEVQKSVMGVSGNTDLKIAYKFDVKNRILCRGIQIYFNPVGLNVHNKLFQLAYWNSVDVAEIPTIWCIKWSTKPANIDVLNGFATYLFDTLLVVPQGSAWVGLIQNEPQTLYGIGLDRNTDSHQKNELPPWWILVYIASAWFLDDSSALRWHTQSWYADLVLMIRHHQRWISECIRTGSAWI